MRSKLSLWPDTFEERPEPTPIKILREQAEILSEKTNGLLSGRVLLSEADSNDGFLPNLCYNFYIVATDKPHTYLLLSVDFETDDEYPLQIRNTVAGTTIQVHDEEKFIKSIEVIFKSPTTQSLMRRILDTQKSILSSDFVATRITPTKDDLIRRILDRIKYFGEVKVSNDAISDTLQAPGDKEDEIARQFVEEIANDHHLQCNLDERTEEFLFRKS